MTHARKEPQPDEDSIDDADAILAELEAEEDADIASLRTTRASEIQSVSHAATTTSSKQTIYVTLKSDDDTLRYTTEHERAIVHFFHPDFARCSIMDDHLTTISQRQADYSTDTAEHEINFAKVDVQHAEFVVQKLGIRVLPCVIGFVKGQIKGRIVGFEGVSWGGKEKGLIVTRAIEEQFVEWGLLRRALVKVTEDDESEEEEERTVGSGRRGITGRKQKIEDENDDWD